MKNRGRWRGWVSLLGCCSTLAACSSSGEDSAASFPGVARWECYANSSVGHCDCYGLGPSDQVSIGGTSITRVSNCSGTASCFTYQDDIDDWACSCGPAGYAPPSGSTNVAPAAKCPP